ncbi:uncharacterized protein PHALS_06220 [Plasmopara halstedii]|uniref:Uncharacterized protein n=1 Tax=Plasmopara halstedii TaxID=4781 RepID=A0A0N7L7Y8_PLAHL|nr:uncharacterized protein PHALS_06220 [Plasmopara halstedii]CEG48395.1 hypothetical protein PHALS_06220 [Plasmopara halstedii]|eukprot:XP_024584764.1 hypothetical protein PHALS_06220 [Plasmopara halstedii]
MLQRYCKKCFTRVGVGDAKYSLKNLIAAYPGRQCGIRALIKMAWLERDKL